jgi:Uma2 family endonuclease
MLRTLTSTPYPPMVVKTGTALDMTVERFIEICQINPDLRMERSKQGDLIMMSPVGGETGQRNARLVIAFGVWSQQDNDGFVFDSSTGFILPNGAIRSPDVAWVRRSRLESLTPEEKQKFLPLCPDFVIELRSPSDRLVDLQEKMEEYAENGAQLGWLIDPVERQVLVYRPQQAVQQLLNPFEMSGDPELAGFALRMEEIWQPGF